MGFLAQFETTTIILWLLLGIGVVGGISFSFFSATKGKKSKRIQSVLTAHRGELGRQFADEMSKKNTQGPRQIRQKKSSFGEKMQNLLGRLNLQQLLESKKLRADLAVAGIRGRTAVAFYVTSRIGCAVGGFFVTLIIISLMKKFPYPEFVRYLFWAGGALIGFYLPKLFLTNIVQKRQAEMTEVFPDVLDLMVICVEAGLGIEQAFARVSEEIVDTSPVLAQEIGILGAELAYLGDRRKAFENFALRTGLPAAKSLATTLIQSEQYGTPVGVAVQVLAKEKRHDRMSQAEKKAASLPAKLTVPMIIFFLPVLFIVVIGPAVIQITSN